MVGDTDITEIGGAGLTRSRASQQSNEWISSALLQWHG